MLEQVLYYELDIKMVANLFVAEICELVPKLPQSN